MVNPHKLFDNFVNHLMIFGEFNNHHSTDSTCDIPEELIEQYKIMIVPQKIIWGEEQFRDRVDFTSL